MCVRIARVVEALEDRVGARTDLLGVLGVPELVVEQRQQPLKAQLVRGAVAADRVDAAVDELADARLDLVADRAHIRRSACRPDRGCPTPRRPSPRTGTASPQPIVTAQSACSCISSVSLFGLRPARSMPTSRIASTTGGHTSRAGSVPADSARTSSRARSARRTPAPSASAQRCGCRRTARTGWADRTRCGPGRWRVLCVHAQIVLHRQS